MGCLAKYCSVLPHFCRNDILYWIVDNSYKNNTNQVSWWWDMTEWWWKIGFMPQAIRRVPQTGQFSNSGVLPLGAMLWICPVRGPRSIHALKHQECVIRSFGTFNMVKYALNTKYAHNTIVFLSNFGSAYFWPNMDPIRPRIALNVSNFPPLYYM